MADDALWVAFKIKINKILGNYIRKRTILNQKGSNLQRRKTFIIFYLNIRMLNLWGQSLYSHQACLIKAYVFAFV